MKGKRAKAARNPGRGIILLETSSYLPLIWRTPYSSSVISFLQKYKDTHSFALQRDCIAEASGYLTFNDDWKYNPTERIAKILEHLDDDKLQRLPFPSTAFQIILGGNMWPQGRYLNFVRH